MKKSSIPFFSIGVTTYDRFKLLRETLISITKQTFNNFVVIVSNDNPERKISAKLLNINDPRIRFINQVKNLGERKNMNFMLKNSKARYFTWLADDDLYHPQFLEIAYKSIKKFYNPACLFFSFTMKEKLDIKKNYLKTTFQALNGREFVHQYLLRSIKTQGCYGVFEKKYLKNIGGMSKLGTGFSAYPKTMPENVFYPYADNFLVIQAGLLKKVIFVQAPLIFFRAHKGSISLVTTDLRAFRTAQKDLINKTINIFNKKMPSIDLKYNIFLLLKWFIKDYGAVLRRSESVDIKEIFKYFFFLIKYIFYLKKPIFIGKILILLVSIFISVIRTRLNNFFQKKS